MATVAVRIASHYTKPSLSPNRMLVKPDADYIQPLTLPWSPLNVTHSNFTADLAQISRVGLDDAFVFKGHKPWKMQMTCLTDDVQIGLGRHSWSAVQVIEHLKTFGLHALRCTIKYGVYESGDWFLSDMTFTSTKRDPTTNEIKAASMDLTWTKYSALNYGTGPVTGGATKSTSSSSSSTTTKKTTNTTTRYYTTKRGDTLWGISMKYYGDGGKWQKIADANGIKDPRKLPVGKKLKIP